MRTLMRVMGAWVTLGLLVLAGCGGSNPPAWGDGGALPGPKLYALTPTQGPLEGGTTVALTGEHLVEGARVFFGEVEGSEVSVPNPRRITVKSPPRHAPGSSDVRVLHPDGQSAVLGGAFIYVAGTGPVDERSCQLLGLSLAGGEPTAWVPSGGSLEALGRVFIPGVTDGAGPPSGLVTQFGVGTEGQDARASEGWAWQQASFHADDVAGGADLFGTTLTPAYTGTRAVAFRYSDDGGQSWRYCDLDGSANGYAVDQQAAVAVSAHVDLGWCNLQHPASLSQPVQAFNPTPIFGQVYLQGVTPGGGQQAFEAQWGWGTDSEDPGVAWTWSPAQFNTSAGNNDEFRADFADVPEGSWQYAFRFRRAGGGAWCFGGLGGSTEGFSGGSNLGQATIVP
jgi:hypothetical protein